MIMHLHYIFFIVVWLCLAVPVPAETIYTWTDEEGVKHFSSEPPSNRIGAHPTKIKSSSNTKNTRTEKRRSSYDRMVKQATAEARRTAQQRKNRASAETNKRKQEEKARHQRQIDAQRKQLEKRIKTIKGRALSPSFSKGMQETQIKQLRQQIEQLNDASKK